jgi:N4-gp56 family major capsid protein
MADVIMGNTELGSTKQELIASLVQKELAFQAVLAGSVATDVSVYAQPGMKSIDFPKLTSFTVVNRTEGVAGEAAALTSSNDTLLLDKNAYVSWLIDAMTAIQSNIPAQMESAKRAAAAMARYVDAQLIAEMRSAASFFVNTGSDVDVAYANLLALVLKLEEADANMADARFIVSPKQKSVLLGLNEFKSNDFYAQNVLKGQIGMILGIPVIVHNGLAQKELFLVEKSGLAIGFQKNAAYGEESDIKYGVGAVRAAVDQLFGVKAMQLAQKGAASGKSPLIVGLND